LPDLTHTPVERHLLLESGLIVSDPDQGIPYVAVLLNIPNAVIPVWHPFDLEDVSRGHNLEGFVDRWIAWELSDDPMLPTHEPRFGHPQYIPRSVIPMVLAFRVEFLRREDARAAHRLRPGTIPLVGAG
jgi:hypothetical protein